MLKVLSYILCDLDPKVKVIGQKAGICDGVLSTSALVVFCFVLYLFSNFITVLGIFKFHPRSRLLCRRGVIIMYKRLCDLPLSIPRPCEGI